MSRKYKIAVMGESNVGKTVFFGSYFHQVTDLSKGKYPVAIKSQASDDKITEIITQLFDKKQVVAGTDVRVDFSFSVDSLGMDIELADLPGGFTTNRNYWDEEEVRTDLQNADGALFFISAYDVINNPSEALKVNRAFADAVSEIRRHTKGDVKGRSDVPIWVIFTKGDTVPEVSVDELASNFPALLDAAKKKSERGNIFTRLIYTKGRYVKAYKTQSLGTWIDATTLPVDFEPINVVEPIEELFEAMLESGDTHREKYVKILAAFAVMIAAGTFAGSYWFDGVHWRNFEEQVMRAKERNDYEAAVKMIDNFQPPVASAMLPGFIRAERNRASLREETYKEYEAEYYAPIAAEIRKINESALPEIDAVFEDTVKRVEQYLDISHFAVVNPEHYSQIRNSAWYFEAARLFNIDPDKEQTAPDDEFEIILRCLNYEAPDNWQARIQSQVEKLLRHWGRTSPSDGNPDNLNPYIDRAEQVLNHPNTSSEVAEYLSGRIQSWRDEQNARWNKIAQGWVNDAGRVPPEEGIKLLTTRLAGRITPEARTTLETARVSLYDRITDNALLEYENNIEGLRAVLGKFPSMPNEDKEKLDNRINFLWEQHIEKTAKSISSSKTLLGLAKIISELGDEAKLPEIMRTVDNKIAALVDARMKEIDAEAGKFMSTNSFADGKSGITSSIQKLQQEIQSAADSRLAASYITQTKELEQKLLTSLMREYLEFCRSTYNSRKHTRSERDIGVCLNVMYQFINLWPETLTTSEGAEVRQAGEFLSAINGGVQGTLEIVSGKFEKAGSIKINISIGSIGYETDVVEGKTEPAFNYKIPVKWSVGMLPVKFVGIEEHWRVLGFGGDKDVLNYTIHPSGFDGYKLLSGTFINNGNSLTVKFAPDKNIPACPW